MSSSIITVSDDSFADKVIKSSQPVLVEFWAPWCGPCKAMTPTLEEISTEYEGRVVVAKMNVDENAHTPVEYGVRSIPYMAFFKNGEIVDTVIGAVSKDKLAEKLDKLH